MRSGFDYSKFYEGYKHFILPDGADRFDGFLIGALDVVRHHSLHPSMLWLRSSDASV